MGMRSDDDLVAERLLAQFFESSPTALLILDPDGVITMVNAGVEAIAGWPRAELLGQKAEILLPARLQPENREQNSPFREPEISSAKRETFILRRDGSEFPAQIDVRKIETADGAMVLAAIVDISERQRLAEDLHDLSALQAAIVASSQDALISETDVGVITSWNAGAERMFGYSMEEVVGRRIFDVVVPDDGHDEEQRKLDEMRRDGQVKSFDARRRHKDGHLIDVGITLSPIRDRLGNISGVAVVKRDISARKRQEERFRAVVESMPTAVVLMNRRGIIEMVNARTEQVFGYSRQELTGQKIEMLIPARFRAAHPDLRNAFFSAPGPRPMGGGRDLYGQRRDGTEVPIEIGLSPLHTDDGLAVLAAITDITERVRTSQTMAEHQRELERSNKELATYAHVASHDLKSPLRGIVQLANWIEEDLQSESFDTIPGHMELLRSRIRRMENLLDDLLAYSHAGRVRGGMVHVDMGRLARELFELQSPPPGLELVLVGDLPEFITLAAPLEQVLRNLFSNAIKHHDRPAGRIEVSCSATDDGFWAFVVTDDGPGIPPKYHERVFEMFQTLRPRDEVEGSGMGLALVKKIVETYGGTITIASDGVRGCSMRFTWPITISGKSHT